MSKLSTSATYETTPLSPKNRKETQDDKLRKNRKWYTCCLIANVALFAVFLGFAIGGRALINRIEHDAVVKNARLFKPDGDSFDRWLDSSVAGQRYEIYVFNVTNPQEYVDGAPIVVDPIGPFVYDSINKRIDLEYEQDDEVVSYRMWQQAELIESESFASDDLVLTMVNPVYITMAEILRPSLPVDGGGQFLTNLYGNPNETDNVDVNRIFMQRPVRDIALGYDDPVLEPLLAFGVPPGFDGVAQVWSEEVAKTRPRDRMFTGKGDPLDARKYVEYQELEEYEAIRVTSWPFLGMKELWGSDEANKVTGFDPYQFPPDSIDEDAVLDTFLPPMFRRVPFTYTGEKVSLLGVEAMRFEINDELTFTEDYYNSPDLPGFMFNSTPAAYDGPTYLFNPHMLNAPAGLADRIIGLTPDPEIHTSVLDVEPRSGATINARIGFQACINVSGQFEVSPEIFPNLTWHDNVVAGFVPIFSAQVVGQLDQDLADFVTSMFDLADTARTVLPIVLGVLAGVCLIASIVFYYKNKANNRKIAVLARNRLLGDVSER